MTTVDGATVIDVLGTSYALPSAASSETRAGWSRCVVDPVGGFRTSPAGAADPCEWTSHTTMDAIHHAAGRLLMLHASGLADDSGRVVALVGPSGAGKSTAATVLARTGFGYVTDETVAMVPATAAVLPFARPLATVVDPGAPKVEFGPDALGLRTCPATLELAGLVALRRREPGADETGVAVRRLGPLAGAQALITETSALAKLPDPLLLLAQTVARCGGVFEIEYADAAQLGPVLHEVLAAAAEPARIDHCPPAGSAATTAAGAAVPPGRWRRTPFTDAIADGASVMVLAGSQAVTLAGIGGSIWRHAADPIDEAELMDRIAAEHGPHPDGARLLAQALSDLQEQGLIERTPGQLPGQS